MPLNPKKALTFLQRNPFGRMQGAGRARTSPGTPVNENVIHIFLWFFSAQGQGILRGGEWKKWKKWAPRLPLLLWRYKWLCLWWLFHSSWVLLRWCQEGDGTFPGPALCSDFMSCFSSGLCALQSSGADSSQRGWGWKWAGGTGILVFLPLIKIFLLVLKKAKCSSSSRENAIHMHKFLRGQAFLEVLVPTRPQGLCVSLHLPL